VKNFRNLDLVEVDAVEDGRLKMPILGIGESFKSGDGGV
jgi:hypothetical protein